MNTRIYEYLLAVAEYKNISQADRSCFISQPALTQHIKKLERQLGTPLFEKKGSQLVPTTQGKIFLTTARRILNVEQETLDRIEKLRRDIPVTYRIFVDIEMRNLLIEQILPKFLLLYPRLKPVLISGGLHTAWDFLDSHYVDVGIFPLHGEYPPSIDSISVLHSEYILLLPPGHPAAEHFSSYGVDMQQLLEDTFILDQEYSSFHDLQWQILHYHNFAPAKIMHTHSMRSTVQMVLNGQGVSFFPNTIMPFLPASCKACSFNPPWRFQYVVAYAKSRGLNIYHTQLANMLTEHYGQFRSRQR